LGEQKTSFWSVFEGRAEASKDKETVQKHLLGLFEGVKKGCRKTLHFFFGSFSPGQVTQSGRDKGLTYC
jgi:hypothetical protein